MKNNILLLVTVILATLGQILLKKGVLSIGGVSFTSEIYLDIKKILSSGYLMFGFTSYAGAMIMTLVVLSKVELSVFALVTSLSYVLIIFSSYYFFGEDISIDKVLGTIFIMIGVYFVVR